MKDETIVVIVLAIILILHITGILPAFGLWLIWKWEDFCRRKKK